MLIFVGMFMESLAAILITFPVLLPVATAVGMNPVHFALMAILNLMIGLTTPPVGMCICTGATIGGVSAGKLQGKYAVPDHQPDCADAGLLL